MLRIDKKTLASLRGMADRTAAAPPGGNGTGRTKASMGKAYFGTDGIRGRTNAGVMTAATAMKVGQAAA